MKTKLSTAAIAVVLAAFLQVDAVDGIAVTSTLRYTEVEAIKPQIPELAMITYGDAVYQPGRIIRMNIANSAVTSCDTIYKTTFARFPVLNMEGTRVAFYRWSARLEDGVLVDQNQPSYLSVMDVDGGNVADLVQCDSRQTLLDWPYGDWIYYTKKGAANGASFGILEVWKVKWNDPTSNTLAYSYSNSRMDNFWRWDISSDASRAMINPHFTDGGYTNVPHLVPFTSVPLPGSQGGTADDQISCNGCISPSGKFIATFMAFGHQASTLSRWEPGTFLWGNSHRVVNHLTDVSDSLGEYCGWQMEMHRWSANSDKWMCLGTTELEVRWTGGNQVLANWVDGEFIKTTNNPYTKTATELPIIYSTMIGDFWVAGGPQGCYEDSTGTWVSVETGDPVSSRTPASLGENDLRAGVKPSVRRTDGGIAVTMPERGEYRVELFGADGHCIRTLSTSRRILTVADRTGARGIAIVRIVSRSTNRTATVRVVPWPGKAH